MRNQGPPSDTVVCGEYFFIVFTKAIEEVVQNLKGSLCDQTGKWIADYARLRFKATLSGTEVPAGK